MLKLSVVVPSDRSDRVCLCITRQVLLCHIFYIRQGLTEADTLIRPVYTLSETGK
jgi:hypothetical protein